MEDGTFIEMAGNVAFGIPQPIHEGKNQFQLGNHAT